MDDRSADIESGMRSALSLPTPSERLRAAANYLMLDALEPIGLTFRRIDQGTHWSSVPECDGEDLISAEKLDVALGDDLCITIAKRRDSNYELLGESAAKIRELAAHIDSFVPTISSDINGTQLEIGTALPQTTSPAWSVALEWLAPLQSRIDDIIGPFIEFDRRSRPVSIESNMIALCVAKHFCLDASREAPKHKASSQNWEFDYTASIIPSVQQCLEVDEFCDETYVLALQSELKLPHAAYTQKASRWLMQPLHVGGRAIADSVFASGCVDFSKPRASGVRDARDIGSSTVDRMRSRIETKVYSERCTFEPDTSELLYLPLSFEGNTFYAVYLFWPTMARRDKFRWAYTVWRDIRLGVTERFRVAIQESYVEAATGIILEYLHRQKYPRSSDVEESLQGLARLYPLPMVKPELGDGFTIKEVKTETNPFFLTSIASDSYAARLASEIRMRIRNDHKIRIESQAKGHGFGAHIIGTLTGVLKVKEYRGRFVQMATTDQPELDSQGHPKLKYALIDRDGARDTCSETDLASHLSLCTDVVRLIYAAAGMAEVAAEQIVRPKHRTNHPYNLYDPAVLACRAFNHRLLREDMDAMPVLLSSTLNHLTVPTDSMCLEIVACIIFELLNNAYHGQRSAGAIEARVLDFREDSDCGFEVLSPVNDKGDFVEIDGVMVLRSDANRPGVMKRSSFIYRLLGLQSLLGIKVEIKVDGMYRVRIHFDECTVVEI